MRILHIANYFALINICCIFAVQVRVQSVQSGDENFEGGLITALYVFRKYTKKIVGKTLT